MDTLKNYDWVGLAEKALIALVILIATWLIARGVKFAMSKLVGKIGFLQKEAADGRSVGAAIGQLGSLLVWLFGLMAILQVFALDQVLAPIQGLLDSILGFVPNAIGAGFVFFIGYVIAKIARELTQTGLQTVGLDKAVSRLSDRANAETGRTTSATTTANATAGTTTSTAGTTTPTAGATTSTAGTTTSNDTQLSSVLANLLFAVILIVVSIAALQILGIEAISEPAAGMLTMILDAIPRILAAAILLGIGWFIARFAAQLLESTLKGLGTDKTLNDAGIVPAGQSGSSVISKIAQVAIVIFFAVGATRLLGFPEITNILNEILELAGSVLFGGVIIAAGVMIAKLLRNAAGDNTAGKVIYWATIALFAAMGLSYMGIADSIINLAFGAVVIGGAVAAALAYGLGGREAAARTLNKVGNKGM